MNNSKYLFKNYVIKNNQDYNLTLLLYYIINR